MATRSQAARRAALLLGGSEDDDYLTPPTEKTVLVNAPTRFVVTGEFDFCAEITALDDLANCASWRVEFFDPGDEDPAETVHADSLVEAWQRVSEHPMFAPLVKAENIPAASAA